MNNPDYQTVYGVGLLDDLHNYFPAFLYEQGRFQTLPQAFSYFRNQLNTRFNLFSYGASLHRGASAPAPVPVPAQPRPATHGYVWQASTPVRPSAEDLAADMVSLNLLTTLLGAREPIRFGTIGSFRDTLGAPPNGQPPMGLPPDIWAAFNSPVVVRPTEAVLAANTELILGSNIHLTQRNCSICQDVIVPTEECRRLRPCQHVYHRTCIDQWFLRSVACPTCRHDIRVATPPSPRLMAALAPEDPPTVPAPAPAPESAPPADDNGSDTYFNY